MPISSLIQRYKSAILHRSEQKGINEDVVSITKTRLQVGQVPEKLVFDMTREYRIWWVWSRVTRGKFCLLPSSIPKIQGNRERVKQNALRR